MNKEQKNNYYNDEDLVNFEKLKNFKKLKENKVETIKKSHPQKYSTFDKENFEKIINFNSKKTEHKNEEKLWQHYPPQTLTGNDKINSKNRRFQHVNRVS